MRRSLMRLVVVAVMVAIAAASAIPAFAFPTDPLHGQQVSDAARIQPSDPYNPTRPGDPYKGQQVSLVARGLPTNTCPPQVGSDTSC